MTFLVSPRNGASRTLGEATFFHISILSVQRMPPTPPYYLYTYLALCYLFFDFLSYLPLHFVIPPILMFNVQCSTPGRFALSSFFDLHFFLSQYFAFGSFVSFLFFLFSLQFLFRHCAQISAFFPRRDNPKNQQVHLIIIHTTRGQPRPCFDTGFWVFISFLSSFSFDLFGGTGIIRIHLGRRTVWIMEIGGDRTLVLILIFGFFFFRSFRTFLPPSLLPFHTRQLCSDHVSFLVFPLLS